MTNRTDTSQGDGGTGGAPPPPPGANENLPSRGNNKVYKSGPLFLSSKGIGWTSWKKRWFILTRTSLVFFRSDPNAIPQKGSEMNLTLGGIDLNSSGSVVVKEDKKLLTVLFPDGRDGRGDGRAFTLKAETLEDLHEWKAALEEALANAPSAALVMGQNGIFRNDQGNAVDASSEQAKDRQQPVKSLVLGRPILLALEDVDGTPSFLEKALRFMEEHGVKVEGILRQAADVDDVERRIREYEQGKNEFTPGEDPHVIADCVKYVLRELPSSPVPASCCNALLEACRTERSIRVSAMRTAICETFPEPNRCLLQRILMMMQAVANHKAENRMSISAVAACMAPLLLRPLLAGDCELEHNFDMGGDGSVQLLQAAAAANHAQAIVITLLEEYNSLFAEGSVSAGIYSESEESGSESEELTEDDDAYEDDEDDYTTEESDADGDVEYASNASSNSIELQGTEGNNNKESRCSSSGSASPKGDRAYLPSQKSASSPPRTRELQQSYAKLNENLPRQTSDVSRKETDGSADMSLADLAETSTSNKSDRLNGPASTVRRGTVWGRAPGKKNLSMESIDLQLEDEAEIHKLEATRSDLQHRISEEAKENARLQESLEKRKNALHERRIALEKDVARLQEQLEKERELRAALEAGLKTSRGQLATSSAISEKVRADLDKIAQAEADVASLTQKADALGMQLNQQREQNSRFQHDTISQLQLSPKSKSKNKDKQKNVETPTTPFIHDRSMRSKYDTRSEKNSNDKDRKQEPSFATNENSLQNQQIDQVQNQKSGGSFSEQGAGRHTSTSSRKSGRSEYDTHLEKTNHDKDKDRKQESSFSTTDSLQNKQTDQIQSQKHDGNSVAMSSLDQSSGRHNSTSSRKSAGRSEGANSTTSALSKLTNRLNFLKERRTQIANELQNMDKSRSSGQPAQIPEKGRGSEARQSGHNTDKVQGSEGQPSDNKEGPDSYSQSLHNSDNQSDKGRKTDSHPNLDREKSESFPPGEKGRSKATPRTNSR